MDITATALQELANTIQDMRIVAERDRETARTSSSLSVINALIGNAVVTEHWAMRIEAALDVLRTESEG